MAAQLTSAFGENNWDGEYLRRMLKPEREHFQMNLNGADSSYHCLAAQLPDVSPTGKTLTMSIGVLVFL